MSEDLTNLGNPLNLRHDEETRNAPHVTQVPVESQVDDLFDDSPEGEAAREQGRRAGTPGCHGPRDTKETRPQNP